MQNPVYNTESIRMGLESYTHYTRDTKEASCFVDQKEYVRTLIREINLGVSDEALSEQCGRLLEDEDFRNSFACLEKNGYKLRRRHDLLCERFIELAKEICTEADRIYGFETFYAVMMTFLMLFTEHSGTYDLSDPYANLLMELSENETPEAFFVNSIIAA